MIDFLDGGVSVAAATIALFFLRFWRDSGDRLFLLFALAFAIFGVNGLILVALDQESEARTLIYLARACAFGLIIAAIIDKNRAARPRERVSSGRAA